MDTTHTKATTIAATAARMIRCQRLMPNTDSPFVGLRHAAYSRDSATVIFMRLRSALSIRSEEHTSELQSLMRISYAVFCLKKQNQRHRENHNHDKNKT